MRQNEWPLIQLLYCVKIERLISEQVTLIPHLPLEALNHSKLPLHSWSSHIHTQEELT